MSYSVVCRVCLAGNVRMFHIADTKLQERFQEVTKIKFTPGDGRPETLCYLCFALVQKFCNFFAMAQSSEKAFKFYLGHNIQITNHTVSELNTMKPKLSISRLKSTSIDILKTPVIMKGIKKEEINIDSNTFAETVEMSDILKDFEQFCKEPTIEDKTLSDTLDYPVNGDIKLENEIVVDSIKQEPLTLKQDWYISMNLNNPIKEEDDDCVILENKEPPIFIDDYYSDVSSEELSPLITDEKENCRSSLIQLLSKKDFEQPFKIEFVESDTEESVVKNKNQVSKEVIRTKQNNTQNVSLSSLFGDHSDNENLSPRKDKTKYRSDRSLLRPFEYGIHSASNDDEADTETNGRATFVPFGYGTQKYNIHNLNLEYESQSQRKREIISPKDVNKSKYYFCDHCFKSYTSRHRLKNHMKSVHNLDLYICNRCDKYFDTEREIIDHLRKNHPGVKYKYSCNHCRKKYKIFRSLLIHKNRYHSPKKKYRCDICRKEYVNRLYFKYHVLFVHPQKNHLGLF